MVMIFNLWAHKSVCAVFSLKYLYLAGILGSAQTHRPHSDFYHVAKMVI